jgi:hypothetical protein
MRHKKEMLKMTEEVIYKCIKGFEVPKYDEDGFPNESEFLSIPIDSEWWRQEYTTISDVRLENDEIGWLEITTETFISNFVKVC